MLRSLSRYGPRFGTTLEVGCGGGYQTRFLAGVSDRVVATEFMESSDPRASAYGIKRAQTGLADFSNVRLLLADGTALPFPDGSFDLVFSSSVLEHVVDPDRAVSEMHRVVKDSGVVVAVVPGFMWLIAFYIWWIPISVPQLTLQWLRARRPSASGGGTSGPAPASPATPPPRILSFDTLRRFLRKLPPPIHGMYSTRREEWKAYRLSRWVAMFERNRLHVVEARAAGFWFQRTFPSSSERSVSRTYRVGSSPLRHLGNGFLIFARKA